MVGPPREKGGPCIARNAGGWGLGTQAIKFNAACEFAFQELSIVRKKNPGAWSAPRLQLSPGLRPIPNGMSVETKHLAKPESDIRKLGQWI